MQKFNAEPSTLIQGACLPRISEVTESCLPLSEGAWDLTGASCNP